MGQGAVLPAASVEGSGKQICFRKDLETIADSDHRLALLDEPVKRIRQVVDDLIRKDPPGGDIVAVAEPAGDREKLELIQHSGILDESVEVKELSFCAGKFKGVGGFSVTVGACGSEDQSSRPHDVILRPLAQHANLKQSSVCPYSGSVTTQRFKLVIAYRGTRYHGWQRQPMLSNYRGEPPPEGQGIPTIQEVLSRTIGELVGHPIKLVGSSRTDSGVHAKAQVAHFDTTSVQIPAEGMRRAINHALPDDIVVKEIVPVAQSFDAILSTTAKRYQYLIWNGEDRPNFFFDLCWHRWMKLDYDAMKEAAKYFVGTRDFASFTKPGHLRETTVRTVRACELSRRGPRIVVGVEGAGFLWQMVRIIVGTLGDVGLGRIGADEIPRIIEARDRRAAGYTAPAEGLFLQWIKTVDEGVAERPRAEAQGLAPDADHVVLRVLRSNYFGEVIDVLRGLGAWFNEERVRALGREIRFHSGYVAIVGQRVVGFLAFNVMEGAAQIQWLGVVEEYQRRGIGRKLVNKVVDDLKRAGLREVFVHTLGDSVAYEPYARTRAFWRAMNFVEHQRIRQENPGWEERLVMRKRLQALRR